MPKIDRYETNNMPIRNLDCIIVGYNDIDFQSILRDLIATEEHSGAYLDLKLNSLYFRGQRITYMDVLNQVIADSTGVDPQFNICQLPNLGVAYLTSYLRRRQLSVDMINFFNTEKERLAELLAQSPRAVAITTTFYVDNRPITELVKFIRSHAPSTKIIVGGPHIFNICSEYEPRTQDYIFNSIGADIYIYDSQGEQTLFLALNQLRETSPTLGEVPNLIYKLDQSTYLRTKREVESNDMDQNVVDWSQFMSDYYVPTVQTRTARSCAFACAFCRYPTLAGPLTGVSLEVIEHELHKFNEAGVQNVVFIDDTFNVPLPRFKELCRIMIRNKFNFNWFSFFRCSNSDESTIGLMHESKCKGVFLGIESGDQTILNNMNKFAKVNIYEQAIAQLKEADIMTFVSIIVGFPGETEETVRNTIRFLEKTQPTFYRAEQYYHYTNVPIHQKAESYGIQGTGYSWRHNTMDWQKAGRMVKTIYKSVQGPCILPGYMFDFWAIPYLLGKGLSLEQIVNFTRIATKILVAGLEQDRPNTEEHEKQLLALF